MTGELAVSKQCRGAMRNPGQQPGFEPTEALHAIARCRDDRMAEVGVRGVEHGDQVGEQPEPVGDLD